MSYEDRNNRFYAGAALGLVAAAGLGFGIARLTQPTPSAPETVAEAPARSDIVALTPEGIKSSQIGIAPAQAGELDAAIAASASIEAMPDAEAVLTAPAPGTISRIFKRIGDPIRAGETLALVESREASAIAAEQASAAARVSLAGRQLAREKTLLAQGVSPRADYETAEANLAVARADARRAGAAMGAARVSRDGRSVAIVSPITGRITAASANLGQFVGVEAELFRVADPTRLQITASIAPADAARVREGDRVELSVGDRRIVEGRVRSATGVVDPDSRAATIVVTPGSGPSAFVPGQRVQARIFASGGAVKSGVIVPQEAVQTLGDRTVVFVHMRGAFRAQTVQAGARSGGLVAIVSGLKAGTAIATTNAFLLKAELEKEPAE